ncbi:ferric reductase transmembrane component 5 [Polyplosphaeria fusca]|uniref:Ferric reductase transmembrane component 5 n=1 Tax=Polyplosphaeria fusca TaxID=682080 RepID=A0A9P4R7R0_9PLEO|nr:ferric reductase transmembrane component 5 [Polyplosphaeria fusca]
MSAATAQLVRRQGYQSQNTSSGSIIDYWGFAVRVFPCANDPGTCEYFDAVYGGHEVGILYTGILWATIGGILLIWAIGRHFWGRRRASETVTHEYPAVETSPKVSSGGISRIARALSATRRAYFLPESLRFIFGRTTRLQLTVLAILTGYLAIWSFAGITYKSWITPVKGYDNLFQKRSSLGPWSDRIGVLAYAMTPLSVMLASRESILSQLTGIPYQSFNFLHRWLGYIIFVQSVLHTIGWTVIEVNYYQPQPQVAEKWIKQLYMIWGCVAMILIFILFLLATPWGIRLTGYEFFRKSHYVLAMVYIGACWGHWQPLKVFMVPGLAIWLFDRLARATRSALIHYQYLSDGSMGFQTASAVVTTFPDSKHGDVVRLDYPFAQSPWDIGQHFYLCFTKASIWQSHPFTPLSFPVEKNGTVTHSYIFRAKAGETKKIANMADAHPAKTDNDPLTTPVVMQGPYGENLVEHLTPDVNVLCIAGGTGITYVLPIVHWLVQQPLSLNRKITLLWAVRRAHDVDWVRRELSAILAMVSTNLLEIMIHVTREDEDERLALPRKNEKEASDHISPASSSRSLGGALNTFNSGKPDLAHAVEDFVSGTVCGRTTVFASGPGSMISDLRAAVAKQNSGARVWKGDARFDVELKCDDRLEW